MVSPRRSILLLLGLFVVVLPGCRTGDQRYRSPRQLMKLVLDRTSSYTLVDVRSTHEYEDGHIPTAVSIPAGAMAAVPAPLDPSGLVIVYGGSGTQSAKAREALEEMGYLRVVDFGAISRWKGGLNRSPLPGECPSCDRKT